ncbi:MAG: HAD family hydrolase [Spirochaetia bacterium]|nr:HAD family hydrolase [Spirochaetia bacterium]
MSIAVIGDVCLDLAYKVTTDGAEVSVETGLQTFSVLQTQPELGGACNVAVNCKTLGANRVDIYGVVGSDFFADLILQKLKESGVGTEGIIRQSTKWSSHVYHKVFEMGKEHQRFDSGNFNELSLESQQSLFSLFTEKLEQYDAVLINEQVPKGLHTDAFQKQLNSIIEKSHEFVLWFADCRKLNDVYRNVIHKLNEQEGRLIHGKANAVQREELAQFLAQHYQNPVIMTLGSNGALVADRGKITRIPGIHFSGLIDSVGAGDAFLAGLAVAKCRQAPIEEAAMVGNLSAGVSLTVLYACGHPTREEVLALAEKADWRYHPEIAEDTRLSVYYADTPIEIIEEVGPRTFPKVAIFDHDGTISTLRQGWERVMEKTMLEAITAERYSSLSLEELTSIKQEIQAFIDRTTGIQTIEQMHHLVDLVKRHEYVPQHKILSAKEYKALYNTALLQMIATKVWELKAGRLEASDLTIKGAVSFLHYLAGKGTKLYLASGTDQEDVQKEANLLGYAHLFEGRIFGSISVVGEDPKRLVIKQIVSSLEVDPSECVIFGDGPVEMREGRKRGLLTIGLSSDEVQRYGTNPAKRSRLILGGAALLLPDFSYQKELCALLGWEAQS